MSVGVADAIRVHMRYNSLVRVNLVVKASAPTLVVHCDTFWSTKPLTITLAIERRFHFYT